MNIIKFRLLPLLISHIVIITLSTCSINGSFQGLYSYYDKTVKISPTLIKKPQGSVCALLQSDSAIIYSINGKELKPCIEQFEKSIVYIWRPKCHSSICISPINMQEYCNKNRIELFIIAEYYDYSNMILNPPIKRPIFGIDCDYYSTNLTKKYISKFLIDLTGEEITEESNYFYLFGNGCLIDKSKSLEDLNI
ncbi:MAG: hypothetical protein EPGJADBJ_05192 [Saprospiraceae bacterium]|nr:hypothetical protein [Saprospiraceae bacterium]